MIDKVLIANRGEIAVRIIRACKELDIRTVAVFSDADKDSLHTKLADEKICIGPAASKKSYLNVPAIIAACKMTNARAVHPGYGFLSENAEFATQCEQSGIAFIGPPPEAIYRMGDKARAKQTMQQAGVPVIPGSDGAVSTCEQAKIIASEIGYPLLIKASSGGGGRGIRLVEHERDFDSAFNGAQLEAGSCFGDNSVYLERFLNNPRHVEIQILADNMGNVIHLGERDCSLQRRNQKVLEECPSPSPLMTSELRAKMGEAAVNAAKAVDYRGAGTVEFLLTQEGDFYFMEMNTRIQVEHPITEEVTGVDLVRTQILVAMGKPLELTQDDVRISGCAIECRINAEDPMRDFRPTPGTIQTMRLPGGLGVRIDSAMYPGYRIPPHYDSMVAKLIVHAPTRNEAILRMRRAIDEIQVEGVTTNIDLHKVILGYSKFISGNYHITTMTGVTEKLGAE